MKFHVVLVIFFVLCAYAIADKTAKKLPPPSHAAANPQNAIPAKRAEQAAAASKSPPAKAEEISETSAKPAKQSLLKKKDGEKGTERN